MCMYICIYIYIYEIRTYKIIEKKFNCCAGKLEFHKINKQHAN